MVRPKVQEPHEETEKHAEAVGVVVEIAAADALDASIGTFWSSGPAWRMSNRLQRLEVPEVLCPQVHS